MAKGGGKRRAYVRDSNGRFASTPGGAAKKAAKSTSGRASTLGARTSLKKSRAKARAIDPADQRLSTALSARAQKGAVTRGNRKLTAAKSAAQTRISGGMKSTIAKPKGLKPGASMIKKPADGYMPEGPLRSRPSMAQRISISKDKLLTKAQSVADELRKVNNAKNRNNDSSWSPKYQKLVDRGAKAERRAASIQKAIKAIKRIQLATDPGSFGFARGSSQRKQMAADLRQARSSLRQLKQKEVAAERVYKDSPVAKYGLWSEIGGNRKQSKKAKARASFRQTNTVDTYVSARMNVQSQSRAIQQMRKAAKTQTAATNKARKLKP